MDVRADISIEGFDLIGTSPGEGPDPEILLPRVTEPKPAMTWFPCRPIRLHVHLINYDESFVISSRVPYIYAR